MAMMVADALYTNQKKQITVWCILCCKGGNPYITCFVAAPRMQVNTTIITVLLASVGVTLFFIERVCLWHHEYMLHSTQLAHDRKMLSLCKNDTIVTTLAAYASTCVELEAKAKEGAMMLSFKRAWGTTVIEESVLKTATFLKTIGWPIFVAGFFVVFVLPSFMFSMNRSLIWSNIALKPLTLMNRYELPYYRYYPKLEHEHIS